MENKKCPHCNEELEYVNYLEDKRQAGHVQRDKNGGIDFWPGELFDTDDLASYTCPHCDEYLGEGAVIEGLI